MLRDVIWLYANAHIMAAHTIFPLVLTKLIIFSVPYDMQGWAIETSGGLFLWWRVQEKWLSYLKASKAQTCP